MLGEESAAVPGERYEGEVLGDVGKEYEDVREDEGRY